MSSDFKTLQIRRVIVHDVPRRLAKSGGQGVTHSTAPISLDDDLRRFLQQRISGSLDVAGSQVEPDPTLDQTVPELIQAILTNPSSDFVGISQQIANHLYQIQTGANPAGLLCVVEVILSAGPALAILKLAREEAIRLDQQTDIQGRLFFDLQHVRDIIMSGKTRVFKAGLFWVDAQATGSMLGRVSDNQRSFPSNNEVALFFLRYFLCCKFTESPDLVTKRMLTETENFIFSHISDPLRKARYAVALYAELSNESNVFSPLGFANTNFALEDRQPYSDWLEENGTEPRQVPKNTELIQERLKKMTMAFASGATVIFPPGLLGEEVNVSEIDSGRTQVVVEGELKRIQGRDQ